MLPSLTRFSGETGFRETIYLESIDAVWKFFTEKCEDKNYKSLAIKCIENAPDTEDFSHALTSAALNAAISMNNVMEFIFDKKINHVLQVSELAIDTIDLYIQSENSSYISPVDIDRKIATNPLMQQEFFRQQEDIEFLRELPKIFDGSVISILRNRAKEQCSLI